MHEWIRLQYEDQQGSSDEQVQYAPLDVQEAVEPYSGTIEYIVTETADSNECIFLSGETEEAQNDSNDSFERPLPLHAFDEMEMIQELNNEEMNAAFDIDPVDIHDEDAGKNSFEEMINAAHEAIGAPQAVESIENSGVFRLRMIERTLAEIQKYIETLLVMIREDISGSDEKKSECADHRSQAEEHAQQPIDERILFGTFNGESFISVNGDVYLVPPNYASKSQLVQGDELKLQFVENGKFQYKQIGPVKRRRVKGALDVDPISGMCWVLCDEGRVRVLNASVSFFKGESGDEVLLSIPQKEFPQWGAVEKIMKRSTALSATPSQN